MIGEVDGQKRGGEVQLQLRTAPNPGDKEVDPLLKEQRDSSGGSSAEIVKVEDRGGDDDLEAGSIPCCRICLESDCDPGMSTRGLWPLHMLAFVGMMRSYSWGLSADSVLE